MIIVPTIVLIGLILSGWMIYSIGYSAGHHDGENHAMDEMAKRAERYLRYKVDGESTRRMQTWSKSVREVK